MGRSLKREAIFVEKLQEEERLPFVIDVKGGEKEKDNDDKGRMSVSINEKGRDC